ncbi:hypothetical protein ABZ901_34365 [Actinacidiphila alni]|uniref:hypothetical protein n=1 Tax=Actinacidiphila alni TaxID=380248 RepID=UPI0033F6DF80
MRELPEDVGEPDLWLVAETAEDLARHADAAGRAGGRSGGAGAVPAAPGAGRRGAERRGIPRPARQDAGHRRVLVALSRTVESLTA